MDVRKTSDTAELAVRSPISRHVHLAVPGLESTRPKGSTKHSGVRIFSRTLRYYPVWKATRVINSGIRGMLEMTWNFSLAFVPLNE